MAASIVSNLFNMETDININDAKTKDFVNMPDKIIEPKTYESISKAFLKDISSILHNCNGYKEVNFEEFNINHKNFQDYHYEIMNNRHLIVIYDKDNEAFKYLTHSGKVFITSDTKVINIINNVPIPYKISMNYIPLINSDKIKSLSLLTTVLFNINIEDPLTLIKEYVKPSVKINDENEYSINYYLFTIYPRIENIINKHNYWKYIHMEQEVYNISRKTSLNNCIDYNYLKTIKEQFINELKSLSEEIKIDINSIPDDTKLFEEVYENTEYYLTLNKDLSNLFGYTSFSKFIEIINNLRLIEYIEKINCLPRVDISNSYGNISSSPRIDISFNFTNKKLLRGTYKDLYFKVFGFLTHNKEYRNIISSDKSLVEQLLRDSNKEEEHLSIKTYFIENYIKARSLGYKTDDEILLYFEKTLKTVVSEEDFKNTKTEYNRLKGLKNLINKYNTTSYKSTNPKLLHHLDCEPLGIAIFDKIRLIQKSLIIEIDKYCQDFNKQNKANIDVIYFDDNYIYLLADEEALNTAFDTLTRVMPNVFSKVCPPIVSSCFIEVLE